MIVTCFESCFYQQAVLGTRGRRLQHLLPWNKEAEKGYWKLLKDICQGLGEKDLVTVNVISGPGLQGSLTRES